MCVMSCTCLYIFLFFSLHNFHHAIIKHIYIKLNNNRYGTQHNIYVNAYKYVYTTVYNNKLKPEK